MHTLMRRTAALALAATIPFGLAACGGDGDKPSKADVKAGFVTAVTKQAGSAGDTAEGKKAAGQIGDCIIDKVYDKVSNKTLNAIKSGDTDSKIDKDDEKTLDSASQDCKDSVKP